jgi:hypothetical protein
MHFMSQSEFRLQNEDVRTKRGDSVSLLMLTALKPSSTWAKQRCVITLLLVKKHGVRYVGCTLES